MKQYTSLFKFLIFNLWVNQGFAQSLQLPVNTPKSSTSNSKPRAAARVKTQNVVLKCDFDVTFVLTNQVDLKIKKRVVITGNQKTETLVHGGYKVEIEDAQGKKYRANKYLEVTSSLAQVVFYRTSSGFDFTEYTQSQLDAQKIGARKSSVRSIIEANYAREFKVTINRQAVDGNAAIRVLETLVEGGFATKSNLDQLNECIALMESTQYNHLKLRQIINETKTAFYLSGDNFQYIQNVINSLSNLESKSNAFAAYWNKNDYYSVISDDIAFYVAAVKEEIRTLPKTESDFLAKVEKNQLELQKLEIAKKSKENTDVQVQPLVVSEIGSPTQTKTEVESATKSQNSRSFVQWWEWDYWDWWEWVLYGLVGVVALVALLSVLLYIAYEY
jgi:hypothetical protein